jgi:leucyl aminopeptidase
VDIKAISGKIQESDAETIIVNLFEASGSDKPQPGGATKAVDGALDGAISDLIEVGDLSGKAGQIAVLYPRGAIPARRVIVVGLGSRDEFDADPAEAVRRAAANAIRKARELKTSWVASILHGAGAGGLSIAEAVQATAEGSLLALYDYQGQKTDEADPRLPESLELMVFDEQDVPEAQQGLATAQAIAAGVTLTRDLVNLPPNICTPTHMAEAATQVAEEVGLRVEVLGRKQMERSRWAPCWVWHRGATRHPSSSSWSTIESGPTSWILSSWSARGSPSTLVAIASRRRKV